MSELDRIVEVRIDKQTASISQRSFGVPLLVYQKQSDLWSSLWDSVLPEQGFFVASNTADIVAAFPAEGTSTIQNTTLYNAAAKIFAQSPKVQRVIIGRLSDDSETYSAVAADLDAIAAKNDDFYYVVPSFLIDESKAGSSPANAKWEALPLFVAARDVCMLFCSPLTNDNLFAKSANSLAAKWSGYNKVVVMANIDNQFPWAAWVGEGAPWDPGSSTWAYKNLNTVQAVKYSAMQRSAIGLNGPGQYANGNVANLYNLVYGQSITEPGKCTSGEWIDIEIGIDWLKVRLQEAVFGNLVQSRKIPYDDMGIQIIGNTVSAILSQAGARGILMTDSISISLPRMADLPTSAIGARHLPDVRFSARVLNAIHTTTIDGVVTL